jgi:hypothetical protein
MGVPVEDQWPHTDISCSSSDCGEELEYAEEIALLTVEVAAQTEQGLVYTPLVAPDDGDYLYEPVFYCHGCWKCIHEELLSYVSDMPPVDDEHSIIECSTCGSGIRAGEVLARVLVGEFQSNGRAPEGRLTPTFYQLHDKPIIICAPCVNVIDQDVSEIWGDPLRQNNECAEGTYMRCWRHGCSADLECNCISGNQT